MKKKSRPGTNPATPPPLPASAPRVPLPASEASRVFRGRGWVCAVRLCFARFVDKACDATHRLTHQSCQWGGGAAASSGGKIHGQAIMRPTCARIASGIALDFPSFFWPPEASISARLNLKQLSLSKRESSPSATSMLRNAMIAFFFLMFCKKVALYEQYYCNSSGSLVLVLTIVATFFFFFQNSLASNNIQ